MRLRISLILPFYLFSTAHAIPRLNPNSPNVQIGFTIYEGFSSANTTESFLGIPYARPPVGNLRFRLPFPPSFSQSHGIKQATTPGHACPQQNFSLPVVQGVDFSPIAASLASTPDAEDCLYLNVVRPAGISGTANLPVVVWIYGGGFMNGDSAVSNGTQIVSRSTELSQSILYVSFNYRVGAFGFLAGKEVKEAGIANLGLHDQRLALQWINKNIRKFGGDPDKVTLYGQSAGSESIVAQMVANGGNHEGLFRGGIMQSGYASPIIEVSSQKHQGFYDTLVQQTNCGSSKSTLDCLRSVDYDILKAAINTTPSMFANTGTNLTWNPSFGGGFLTESWKTSIKNGRYAKIPLIAGDVDDEGTLFTVGLTNITTDVGFLDFVHDWYLPGVSYSNISAVGQAYPSDPADGSPFGTGDLYNLTTQYKRLAAFVGDAAFQSDRRSLLQTMSKTQDTWSYLSKAAKDFPFLGSIHGVDISEFFGDGSPSDFIGTDALINFVNNLNPNTPANAPASLVSGLKGFNWPLWNSDPSAPVLMQYNDVDNITLTADTYRQEAMELLNDLFDQIGA